MHSSTFSLSLCFLLSSLLLSSFHGGLYVHGQATFSFDSGKINQASLQLTHGTVDSSGILTLDSSSGDTAEALYSTALPLYGSAISKSVLSFSTFFTFSSNSTSGNGTIAFVVVPDTTTTGLAAARQTFTVELNTSCASGVFNESDSWGNWNGSDPDVYGPGRGYWGPGFGGGRGGPFGGFFGGGFQVVEYANGSSVEADVISGYGPEWDPSTYQDAPFFCSQQPDNTYHYLVAIEYNATTDQVSIGSPSCGGVLARTTTFAVKDLSGIPAFSNNLYVGFMVTGGAVYSLSQWNFTNNATTNSVMSLALSSSVSTPGGSGGSTTGGGAGGSSKKYVIPLSVLGSAIGVAAVVCTCCLCMRKRRAAATAAPIFVAKSTARGTIPESEVVYEATKPYNNNAPPIINRAVQAERETAPLNTYPNSAFTASTGGASWLQPVTPR